MLNAYTPQIWNTHTPWQWHNMSQCMHTLMPLSDCDTDSAYAAWGTCSSPCSLYQASPWRPLPNTLGVSAASAFSTVFSCGVRWWSDCSMTCKCQHHCRLWQGSAWKRAQRHDENLRSFLFKSQDSIYAVRSGPVRDHTQVHHVNLKCGTWVWTTSSGRLDIKFI